MRQHFIGQCSEYFMRNFPTLTPLRVYRRRVNVSAAWHQCRVCTLHHGRIAPSFAGVWQYVWQHA
jgi:hypothetical protein